MKFEIKSLVGLVVDLPKSVADDKIISEVKKMYSPLPGILILENICSLQKDLIIFEKPIDIPQDVKVIAKTNINRYYIVEPFIKSDSSGVYITFRYMLDDIKLIKDWIDSGIPTEWYID